MSKKFLKIIVTISIILTILILSLPTFAVSGSDLVNVFNGNGGISTTDGEGLAEKIIGAILSAIRIIAIGLAIIILTYLGIKYMSAAPSEKANIKNQLVTYTIGAVLVVGTTSILSIIKDTVTSITK